MGKMNEFWSETSEIRREARLKIVRDCVIYNLNHRPFAFDKMEIRKKLNAIADEEALMELQLRAMTVDNIESFLSLLQ